MKKQVFEYFKYKEFLLDWIEAAPNKGRGQSRKIAEYVGCQVAYVSHVLAADRDFNLEQAEAISRYMQLEPAESDYLINLVEYARAGSHQLKAHYKRILDSKRQAFQEIQNRIAFKDKISEIDQSIYYSSWHYQAIRVALTSPEFRTVQKLSKRLGIKMERVLEILEFFQDRGLVEKKGSEYFSVPKSLHLGKDSPLIGKMHSNWRIHALGKIEERNDEDLHYSACVTLGKEDFENIREIIMQAVLKATNAVKKSGSNTVCAMNFDFYEL